MSSKWVWWYWQFQKAGIPSRFTCLLQPLWLTWGVPSCRGETPFLYPFVQKELTNGFLLSPLLSAGEFPFHSLTCASNNISHLVWHLFPLSSKHFTSKQLLLLPSEFWWKSWELLDQSCHVWLGVRVKLSDTWDSPQPRQDQRELPAPEGRGPRALRRSSRRGGPGKGCQHRFHETSSEPFISV